MHDPLPVRLVECRGDFDAVAQRRLRGQWAVGQALRECLALEILHDEIIQARFVAHVEQRTDVRVREARDGLRLALESLAQIGPLGEVGRQNLDRDDTLEPRVERLVHLAHAAGAERGSDLVGSEPRA